ncbi:hypothetical protein SEA_NANOSMITE_52 [Mycobacterium phage Nanosmite]|nr:hypothetical protein SEA_NANOSMITE_52 [Mycobacterium phage Nanosmite]
MSKKNKKNEPTGLKLIGQLQPVGDGVKVTGANLGKITHLLSLDAENLGVATSLAVSFASDGQLTGLTIFQGGNKVALQRDDFLVRSNGALWAVTADEFDQLNLTAA